MWSRARQRVFNVEVTRMSDSTRRLCQVLCQPNRPDHWLNLATRLAVLQLRAAVQQPQRQREEARR